MAKKSKTSKNKSKGILSEDNPRQDTGPSARWQHSDYEDSSPDDRNTLKIRRVLTVADTLCNAGTITDAEKMAYNKYRYHYESALMGYSASGEKNYGNGDGLLCYEDIKVASANALRAADAILSRDERLLMFLCAIRDMRWLPIQEFLRANPEAKFEGGTSVTKLREGLVGTLQRLALHYSGELYREKRVIRRDGELYDVLVQKPAAMECKRKSIDYEALKPVLEERREAALNRGLSASRAEELLVCEFGRSVVEACRSI